MFDKKNNKKNLEMYPKYYTFVSLALSIYMQHTAFSGFDLEPHLWYNMQGPVILN